MSKKSTLISGWGVIVIIAIIPIITSSFIFDLFLHKAIQQQLGQLADAVSQQTENINHDASVSDKGTFSWLKAYPYIRQVVIFNLDGQKYFQYQQQGKDVTNKFVNQWQQEGLSNKKTYSDSEVIHSLYPLKKTTNGVKSLYMEVDKAVLGELFYSLFYWYGAGVILLFLCVLALVYLLINRYILPTQRLMSFMVDEQGYQSLDSRKWVEQIKQKVMEEKADKQSMTQTVLQLEQKLNQLSEEKTNTVTKFEAQCKNEKYTKYEIINVIGRELKVSLHKMVNDVELLKLHVVESRANETVNQINDTTHHLLNIVGQLEDYSTLSGKQLSLSPQHIDLYQFLSSVIHSNKAKTSQKNHTLSLSYQCYISEVMVDHDKLRQILNHLIDNANKFSRQGTIELSLFESSNKTQDFITFSVSDSGPVLAEGEKECIFEPFKQSLSSEQQTTRGLGLGLTVSAQLITLMQGEYGVEATEKGNRFWFSIPVDVVSTTTVLPGQTTQNQKAIDKGAIGAILIVEDNEVNQSVARGMLEKLGCSVELVSNGEDAIKACSHNHYDMILMDYHMSQMSGITTTQHIRDKLKLTTPIIALTADTGEQVKFDFYAVGANAILIKPVSFNKLIDLVNEFLGQSLDKVLESAEEHSAGEATPVLNMQVVNDIIDMAGDNGQEMAQQIFEVYMEHSPELIRTIKQAYLEKNSEQLFKSAHGLKSSSLNIGAAAVAELAKQIESLARENNFDQIGEYIDKLDTYYNELILFLNGQWRGI